MEQKISVGIRFTVDGKDLQGAIKLTKDELSQLVAQSDKATASTKKHEEANQGLLQTLGSWKQAVVGIAAAYGGFQLMGYIQEATKLAARYETLGVSMGVVGKNAGYTATQMESFAIGLQKTGISMIESRQQIMRLAGSKIDLAMAEKLGRAAQDAAVIGNINSSEAFARMIHGIRTGQSDVLRTIGLNVNMEAAYQKLATTLNVNVSMLSENQKAQARANAVLLDAAKNAGTYEAAMGTAGKQVQSMVRYIEDFKVKLGGVFLEEFTQSIFAQSEAWKELGKWMDKITKDGTVEKWGHNIAMAAHAIIDAITATTKFIIEHKAVLVTLAVFMTSVWVGSMVTAAGAVAFLTRGLEQFIIRVGAAALAADIFATKLAKNPLGLLLVALSTAIGAWVMFRNSTKDAGDEIEAVEFKLDRLAKKKMVVDESAIMDEMDVLDKYKDKLQALEDQQNKISMERQQPLIMGEEATGVTYAPDLEVYTKEQEEIQKLINLQEQLLYKMKTRKAFDDEMKARTAPPADQDAWDKLSAKYKEPETWTQVSAAMGTAFNSAVIGVIADAQVKIDELAAISGEADPKVLDMKKELETQIEAMRLRFESATKIAKDKTNADPAAAAKTRFEAELKLQQIAQEQSLSLLKQGLAAGLVTQRDYAAAEYAISEKKAQDAVTTAEYTLKHAKAGAGHEAERAKAVAGLAEAQANLNKTITENETKRVEAYWKEWEGVVKTGQDAIKVVYDQIDALKLSNEEIGLSKEGLLALKIARDADIGSMKLQAAAAYEQAAALADAKAAAARNEAEGMSGTAKTSKIVEAKNLEQDSKLYLKSAADIRTLTEATDTLNLKRIEAEDFNQNVVLKNAQQNLELIGKTTEQQIVLKMGFMSLEIATDKLQLAKLRDAAATARQHAEGMKLSGTAIPAEIAAAEAHAASLEKQVTGLTSVIGKKQELNEFTLKNQIATAEAELKNMQEAYDAIGLNAKELGVLKAAKMEDEIASMRASIASKYGTEEYTKQMEAIDKLAAVMRKKNELAIATGEKQAFTDWWKGITTDIERGLTDSLMRGFEAGKNFGKSFIDSLKTMFKTTVLKMLVQGTMSMVGMGGSGPSFGDMSSGAFGGTGGSLLNAASQGGSLYNLATGNVGGGAYGAFANSAVGAGLGLSSAGSMSAMAGADIALGGLGGSAGGAALGGASGGLTALGTALPYIAAALVAIQVIQSFMGKGGGPKLEGQAHALMDKAGQVSFQNSSTVPSGDYSGRWELSGGLDSAMKDLAAPIGRSIADLVNKLGGTAAGVGVNVAGNSDPQGTAGDYFQTVVTNKGGQAVYTAGSYDVGRGNMEKVLQDQIPRMVLAGIKASEGIDKIYRDIIDGVNLTTASTAELNAVMKKLSDTFDNIATVKTVFTQLGMDATAITGTMATNIVAYFGGAASTLSSAFGAYYTAMYSDAEKLELQQKELTSVFALLGKAVPATKEEFKNLVKGLDLAKVADQELFAKLMALAPVFAVVADAAVESAQKLQDTADQLAGEALDSVTSAINEQIQSTNDAASAARSAADSYGKLAETLRKTLASIQVGELSPKTTPEQYADALLKFTSVSDLAAGGDRKAMEELSQVSTDFLKLSRLMNASSEQYNLDWEAVNIALEDAAVKASQQRDFAEWTVSLLETHSGFLTAIRDELQKVDPNTEILNAYAALDGAVQDLIEGAVTGTQTKIDYLALNGIKAVFDLTSLIGFIAQTDKIPQELADLMKDGTRTYMAFIQATLDDETISDEAKRLVVDRAGSYKATIEAIIDSPIDTVTKILALKDLTDVTAIMTAVLESNGMDDYRKVEYLQTLKDVDIGVKAALIATGLDDDARVLILQGISNRLAEVKSTLWVEGFGHYVEAIALNNLAEYVENIVASKLNLGYSNEDYMKVINLHEMADSSFTVTQYINVITRTFPEVGSGGTVSDTGGSGDTGSTGGDTGSTGGTVVSTDSATIDAALVDWTSLMQASANMTAAAEMYGGSVNRSTNLSLNDYGESQGLWNIYGDVSTYQKWLDAYWTQWNEMWNEWSALSAQKKSEFLAASGSVSVTANNLSELYGSYSSDGWVDPNAGLYAEGLPNVPYDLFPARLHKNEAVIDATTMAGLRKYGIPISGDSGGMTKEQADALLQSIAEMNALLVRISQSSSQEVREQTLVLVDALEGQTSTLSTTQKESVRDMSSAIAGEIEAKKLL